MNRRDWKQKLLYTSFSPSSRVEDVWLNLAILLQPWRWRNGSACSEIVEWFRLNLLDNQSSSAIFTFNYARSAMYLFFKALRSSEKDEVIFQGFTCAAAINPAMWAGLKPVYVDIDPKSLCIDFADVESKVTDRTAAIVIQYTLGQSADVERIVQFAHARNILVLEDCTHGILAEHNGRRIGLYGDAAIYSLGRDKAFSGVDGGVLVVHHDILRKSVGILYEQLKQPGLSWIFRELLYPLIWWLVKKTYSWWKFGKLIHLIASKSGLLVRATSSAEKRGEMPGYIPALMPNALATLALNQLKDHQLLNSHRQKISEIYSGQLNSLSEFHLFPLTENSFPLRFPLLMNVGSVSELLKFAQSENILLGDWFAAPIAPVEVDMRRFNYVSGNAPYAEELSKKIVNLPTHINIDEKDALRITDLLKRFIASSEV